MAGNNIFSYTKRDYEGSRMEGLARIPILSQGQWTDLNSTDPGVILLDYVHALVDMCNYYQDHQALEAFLSTAKERVNIFRLAKQLSYNIRSAKGATVDVTFSTPIEHSRPVFIPKHTRLTNKAGNAQYLTKEDAYLEVGKTSVIVPCYQGEYYEKIYTGTGVSRFSTTVGAENQYVILTASNIDVETISIEDSTGRLWTPVDYITFSNANDRVYQIDLNHDDSVTIRFGDGERGMVPGETDVLTIKYIVTKASEGRVGANELISLLDTILDSSGAYVDMLVNNNKASIGGSTIQSSAEIKSLAPGAIKAQNRAVTLADYENLAKLVPGVSEAKAYDINTKPDLCLYHEVKVLVSPTDTTGDTESLRRNVYNFLADKMIPPTNLQVLTPNPEIIDIEVTVRKLDNVVDSRLEYNIHSAIVEYFKERSGDIGEDFYPADLSANIQRVNGIRYVSSMSPNDPVPISDMSVASLGTVRITIM